MTDILWDVFEISVTFFQGFIMIYFPFKFLKGKFSDSFLQNHGAMFSVLLSGLVCLFNKVTVFEHFLFIFYILLIFIYCVLCLNGSLMNKLFASIVPVVIVLTVTILAAGGSAVLFNTSMSDVMSKHNTQRVITVIMAQFLFLYMHMITLNIFKKHSGNGYQLSRNEWLLVSFTLTLSIVLGVLFVLISFDELSHRSRIYILLGILTLLIINTVSIYLIIDIGRKNHTVRENEKLKLQMAYYQNYVENANTEFNLIQKLRHDSKAIYQVLGDFLARGEIDKANSYLRKLTDIADDRIIFINTENDFANSIINARLTMAKSFGIHASCLSVNDFEGIDDTDLCRLLSNMLDNAITATSQSAAKEKKITVNISEEIGTYRFLVCNTIDESVLEKNPELNSTKKNKKVSGYGTKIIKDLAEKYHGKCDFYERESLFCCLVILNTDKK